MGVDQIGIYLVVQDKATTGGTTLLAWVAAIATGKLFRGFSEHHEAWHRKKPRASGAKGIVMKRKLLDAAIGALPLLVSAISIFVEFDQPNHDCAVTTPLV